MKTITYNEQTHRLVPVEPTESMADAGWDDAVEHEVDNVDIYDIAAIYRTMLSAAPQPEPVEVEPEAYYVQRIAPGKRDDGMRLGSFFNLESAEEWADEIHVVKTIYTAPPDYEAVKKQRDELMEMLEKVTAKLAWLNSDDCAHIMALTDEAEAALASVKGEEA